MNVIKGRPLPNGRWRQWIKPTVLDAGGYPILVRARGDRYLGHRAVIEDLVNGDQIGILCQNRLAAVAVAADIRKCLERHIRRAP